jgi:hypothetical protein
MTEHIFNALHTQTFDPSFVHWTSKTKWKYFKITLLSFEITGIHMYNMYKSVEK